LPNTEKELRDVHLPKKQARDFDVDGKPPINSVALIRLIVFERGQVKAGHGTALFRWTRTNSHRLGDSQILDLAVRQSACLLSAIYIVLKMSSGNGLRTATLISRAS
jgi:hypothetical protein